MGKERIFQSAKYLLVGGSTALLELMLFWLLCLFTADNLVLSNIIAVLTATCANFLLNGKLTFQGSSNMLRSAVLYTLLFLFNLAFSTITINALGASPIPPVVVKAFTQACIVVWNFILYRKVVFR